MECKYLFLWSGVYFCAVLATHKAKVGPGLYSKFKEIHQFHGSDFRTIIFNSHNSWIVEFYNSWCGHCHVFAKIWKQLALDIYGWREVIAIGAVDCSNPSNRQVCKTHQVKYYPQLKYFPPLPANDFHGLTVWQGFAHQQSVSYLVTEILKILRNSTIEGLLDLPILLPYDGTLKDVWLNTNDSVKFTIIAVQNNESFTGEGLALNLLKVPSVKVLIVNDTNTELISSLGTKEYPTVYILSRDGSIEPVEVDTNQYHIDVYNVIRNYLAQKGENVPEIIKHELSKNVVHEDQQNEAIRKEEEEVKTKLNISDMNEIVFQVDIENALRHTLKFEIPLYTTISGESLIALNLYLETLYEFFPFNENGREYLKALQIEIKDNDTIYGIEFLDLVTKKEELYSPYLSPGSEYIGCRGSKPKYRGYPCGMWTMFHALTVHADYNKTPESKKVLRAMLGYIKNFFGCLDCSQHFESMAVSFEGNVSTTEDSVLWLWKAHNSVNKRLRHDPSEDPRHPKLPFPPMNICQQCYNDNGTWNEQMVLEYLRIRFKNISRITLDELANISIVNTSSADRSMFSGSIQDVIFFTLLFFSVIIIVAVCIRFVFEKLFCKRARPVEPEGLNTKRCSLPSLTGIQKTEL